MPGQDHLGLAVLEQVALGAGLERVEDPALLGERGEHQDVRLRVRGQHGRRWRRRRRCRASTGPSARRRAAARRPAGPPPRRPAASPTTTRSAVVESRARSPPRTIAWSSTRSTEITGAPASASRRSPGIIRPGPRSRRGCPGPGAERTDSVPPESSMRSPSERSPMWPSAKRRSRSAASKPAPVVVDDEACAAPSRRPACSADVPRVAVGDDVAQHLLAAAEEHRRHVQRQVGRPVDVEVHG